MTGRLCMEMMRIGFYLYLHFDCTPHRIDENTIQQGYNAHQQRSLTKIISSQSEHKIKSWERINNSRPRFNRTNQRAVLTLGHELISRENELISRGRELISRGNELISRGHDLISRGNEFISCGHELKKILHMSLPGFRRLCINQSCFF